MNTTSPKICNCGKIGTDIYCDYSCAMSQPSILESFKMLTDKAPIQKVAEDMLQFTYKDFVKFAEMLYDQDNTNVTFEAYCENLIMALENFKNG